MTGSGIAIRTRGLQKIYRVYASPFDALMTMLDRKKRYSEHVALADVTLELHRGEIIGVLGRNGAGKSTLLKIISGTLDRTAGELEVNGRITAILELGTGFHPEYTGRENIYMGGLCLGMSRAEIDAKIDSVIDFSELHDVIDQPFKTYSTGMQTRLTFSTAISVEPDILIIDEALSVGDARFQLKCYSWINRLREKNATVLLVSHDTGTITTFCDRALILENGRIFADGNAKKITVLYHNLLFGQSAPLDRDAASEAEIPPPTAAPEEPAAEQWSPLSSAPDAPPAPDSFVRYGSGEAELVDWGLYDDFGQKVAVVETGSHCRFAMTIASKVDIPDLSAGFAIKDRKGTILWGATNLTDSRTASHVARGEVVQITARCTMWLAAGDYFVTLGAAHHSDGTKIDFIEDGISFCVIGPTNIFTTSIVNLESVITVEPHSQGRPVADLTASPAR